MNLRYHVIIWVTRKIYQLVPLARAPVIREANSLLCNWYSATIIFGWKGSEHSGSSGIGKCDSIPVGPSIYKLIPISGIHTGHMDCIFVHMVMLCWFYSVGSAICFRTQQMSCASALIWYSTMGKSLATTTAERHWVRNDTTGDKLPPGMRQVTLIQEAGYTRGGGGLLYLFDIMIYRTVFSLFLSRMVSDSVSAKHGFLPCCILQFLCAWGVGWSVSRIISLSLSADARRNKRVS